jgi:hypothetical protein
MGQGTRRRRHGLLPRCPTSHASSARARPSGPLPPHASTHVSHADAEPSDHQRTPRPARSLFLRAVMPVLSVSEARRGGGKAKRSHAFTRLSLFHEALGCSAGARTTRTTLATCDSLASPACWLRSASAHSQSSLALPSPRPCQQGHSLSCRRRRFDPRPARSPRPSACVQVVFPRSSAIWIRRANDVVARLTSDRPLVGQSQPHRELRGYRPDPLPPDRGPSERQIRCGRSAVPHARSAPSTCSLTLLAAIADNFCLCATADGKLTDATVSALNDKWTATLPGLLDGLLGRIVGGA